MMAKNPLDQELFRTRVLLAAMLVIFAVLTVILWQIQVAHGHRYKDDLTRQSVRRIRLPGMRGRIYDRNGECLADNRPSYCLAVYLEELRCPGTWSNTISKVETLIHELSVVLGVPPEITRADVWAHIRKRLPLSLPAWRGLDEGAMARWAELASGVPGVDIYLEAIRVYPQGACAAHVLGYVGRADPVPDGEERYDYYMPEMEGKTGIEKRYNHFLRGEAGGRLVRVDVSGYRHEDMGCREPKSGQDVLLAIDLRIQKLAEKALGGEPGSIVILDPRNGDVLAMASSPGFDPNAFVPSISFSDWNALLQNPGKPLLNRAVAGSYTPGSTFKPVVAMAALESNLASPDTTFRCPGFFQLGRRKFHCWYAAGHGPLNMREALEHSCNVYFFKLALQCGYDAIYHMAEALGLGRKTGVEIDNERAGLLPDEIWKRRVFNDAWRDGDTCNLSIGQGALTVTPIQMAVVVATIANGGYVYKPRMVLGTRDSGAEEFKSQKQQIVNNMHWSIKALQTVQGGMEDVVMSPCGTGKRARVLGLTMAGKTGTAEYGKKGEGHKYGWMIAFAPLEEPRYAVAMVVDQAVSGGVTVAPRIRELMAGIFGETETGGGAG